MSYTVKYPFSIVAAALWIGFVGAISFMEAWLKFKAPGVTIPLGVGIGRIIFFALNKVEIILLVTILCNLICTKEKFILSSNIILLLPIAVLITQTLWLLPALDTRAELYIKGEFVEPSFHHMLYIILEVFKITGLIFFILSSFKKHSYEYFN